MNDVLTPAERATVARLVTLGKQPGNVMPPPIAALLAIIDRLLALYCAAPMDGDPEQGCGHHIDAHTDEDGDVYCYGCEDSHTFKAREQALARQAPPEERPQDVERSGR